MSKETEQIQPDKLKAKVKHFKAWYIKDNNQDTIYKSEELEEGETFDTILDSIVESEAFPFIIIKMGSTPNAARSGTPFLVKLDENFDLDTVVFEEPEVIITPKASKKNTSQVFQESSLSEQMDSLLSGIKDQQDAREQSLLDKMETRLAENNLEWEKKLLAMKMEELAKKEEELAKREKELGEKEQDKHNKVKSAAKEIIPALGSLIMDFASGEKSLAGFTKEGKKEQTTEQKPKPDVKPAEYSFEDTEEDEEEFEEAEEVEETEENHENNEV